MDEKAAPTSAPKSELSDHIVHLADGKLKGMTRQDVDRLVEKAMGGAGECGGLVLHFHGGLVNEPLARSIAARLVPQYRLNSGEAYPFYFVWEAGLWETIVNNAKYRDGFFLSLLERVIHVIGRHLGQKDAVTWPAGEATADRVMARLKGLPDEPGALSELTSTELDAIAEEIERDAELARLAETHPDVLDPEKAATALAERGGPGTKAFPLAVVIAAAVVVVHVLPAVVRRLTDGSHHGLHATIVEEFLGVTLIRSVAREAWTQMKKDCGDAFGGDRQRDGGTAVLDSLREAVGGGQPPRITLVGHSTGAIFVCELLAAADEMELDDKFVFDVILHAPAARFDLLKETLEQHRDRIANFRMFTMCDDLEKKDNLVGRVPIYPRSMLYFVSGVAEDKVDTPLVGMDRFFDIERFPASDYPDLEPYRNFVGDDASRVVWSPTCDLAKHPCGRRSKSADHSDFDYEDKLTLCSVKHILGRGFDGNCPGKHDCACLEIVYEDDEVRPDPCNEG